MRRLSLVLPVLALLSCGGSPTVERSEPKEVLVEKSGASYKLKLQYPVLQGVPREINAAIATAALTHLEQVEDDPIPVEEYAKNLAEESAGQQWVFESVLTVAHQSPNLLTTLCKTYTNTGAAHPNVFHYYEVYDLRTAKRLELSDLVLDGKLDDLRKLANVTGDFPNEPAIGLLPNHVAFRADPDARMVLDAEIPYDKLKGILKPQFLP